MTTIAKLYPTALFFALAYGISWTVWLTWARLLPGWEAFYPVLVVGSFGPFLAAVLTSALRGGRAEAVAYLRGLLRWRAPLWVWLAAWLVFPAVLLAGMLLFNLGNFAQTNWAAAGSSLLILMPINAALTGLLSAGPLGEEPGWRGFALPRMLPLGELRASLLLGLLWGFWHLPLALTFGEFRQLLPGLSLAEWLSLYPLSVMAMALAMTQLWKWSGSVPVAIFFHAVVNHSTNLFAGKDWSGHSPAVNMLLVTGLFWTAAGVFMAIDRWAGRRGLEASVSNPPRAA